MISGPAMEMTDNGEGLSLLTPLLPDEQSTHWRRLTDMARQLLAGLDRVEAALRPDLRPGHLLETAISETHYSNLIEGHELPINAIRSAYHGSAQTDAQIEALSLLDAALSLTARTEPTPNGAGALLKMHEELCRSLPEALRRLTGSGPSYLMVPGEFRTVPVAVGRHVAPSPGAVPRLIEAASRIYAMNRGQTGNLIAMVCAHHRFSFIHPFADLNGRVGRLMTRKMLQNAHPAGALVSLSRGLQRERERYFRALAHADDPRHGGADGRGNLSEARLAEFAAFMLEALINETEEVARGL